MTTITKTKNAVAKKTIRQLIVDALTNSPQPMLNHEIRNFITKNGRPDIDSPVLDTMLWQLSRSGHIEKRAVRNKAPSKNIYFICKPYKSTRAAVLDLLVSSKMKYDSKEIFDQLGLRMNLSKKAVDVALYDLRIKGLIRRSKNPMTDTNIESLQSKFLYFK